MSAILRQFSSLVQRTALLVCAVALAAQPVSAQDAVVTRNVNLRHDPSTAQSPIRLLLPTAELRLLEPGKTNSYYHVATMSGDEGWVWGNNVRILPPAPGPAEVFNGCPMEGNASRADYRALNRLKNRTTTPRANQIDSAITLASILQPGSDSSRWADTVGATVTGFVFDAKAGSEESVNCGATKVADKDTHIELTLSASDTAPTRRVIVEVTPKWRAYEVELDHDWSTAVLRHDFKGHCVEVTGWMFWDGAHRKDAENTSPGTHDNWRATAWEIHPVTAIREVPCAS